VLQDPGKLKLTAKIWQQLEQRSAIAIMLNWTLLLVMGSWRTLCRLHAAVTPLCVPESQLQTCNLMLYTTFFHIHCIIRSKGKCECMCNQLTVNGRNKAHSIIKGQTIRSHYQRAGQCFDPWMQQIKWKELAP